MNTKDAIKSSAGMSGMVLKSYVSDMDDAELMQRPGDKCNHLAWQLGHLISSEVSLLEMIAPGRGVALPEGFAEAHSKENCDCDDPQKFLSKEDYIQLFDQVTAASGTVLDELAEEDLDKPAPEHFRSFCPTIGDMFTLIATHPMMHAGQFAVVRRQTGKPILM